MFANNINNTSLAETVNGSLNLKRPDVAY